MTFLLKDIKQGARQSDSALGLAVQPAGNPGCRNPGNEMTGLAGFPAGGGVLTLTTQAKFDINGQPTVL
jgi:hypothetical protein